MLADSQLSSQLSSGVRFRKNDSAFGTKYKLSHKNNSFCWEEFNLDLTLTSLSIINATLYTRKRHCLMLFVRGHSSAGRAPALQAGGRRFDPVWLHHFPILIISRLRPYAARPHNALCVFVVCDPVSTGTLLPVISIYQGSCKAGWAVDQASLMFKNIHTGRTPVMESVRPAIFIRGE